MLKLLVSCLVLMAVTAVELDGGAPSLYTNYEGDYAGSYHNYEPRAYEFGYGVSDPHTGDHKSQWETKDKAGVVRGGYSLLEPDGTTRVVEYIADEHGFRAVVKKLGHSVHPDTIETHGNVEIAPEVQVPVPTPLYQSYDGHAGNYGQIVAAPLVKSVEVPEEIAYQGGYQPEYLEQAPILADKYENQALLSPIYTQKIEQEPVYTHQVPVYRPEPIYAQNVLTPYAQGLHQPIVSSSYHGLTGNPDDDSAYTQYLDDSGYQSGPHQYISNIKPLPYNFVVGHSILQ